MSADLLTGAHPAWGELLRGLGVDPENVYEFSLHVRVGEVVSLTVREYVEAEGIAAIAGALHRFRLVEREEDGDREGGAQPRGR